MSHEDCPFLVKAMAKDLRIWKGVGNGTKRTGNYVPPGADTIAEVNMIRVLMPDGEG